MKKLYMIACPIGNFEDITLRALRILKEEAEVVACEDTRVTQRLLLEYNIQKPLISCHSNNELEMSNKILDLLQTQVVAYLSDAGTPGISDPGNRLVSQVIKAGGEVYPLPGASAITTLVSASGLPLHKFIFGGFLPTKKGRQTQLSDFFEKGLPLILYEAPHRILSLLNSVNELAPSASLVCGRELSKEYEELLRGNSQEILDKLSSRKKIQGEFTVAIVWNKNS